MVSDLRSPTRTTCNQQQLPWPKPHRRVQHPGPRTLPHLPTCGHTAKENRPTQEKFHCVACGHTAHADTVAATNVLRAGLVHRDANPA
ncbi:zinc ribbon domain-containing protein [Streptomyces mirabilis]|uniref:zinc ribbon domain-containing protein n=1 Tax=Streptomyces mirabilis TaxID=68239 RepID=UPI0031BA0279